MQLDECISWLHSYVIWGDAFFSILLMIWYAVALTAWMHCYRWVWVAYVRRDLWKYLVSAQLLHKDTLTGFFKLCRHTWIYSWSDWLGSATHPVIERHQSEKRQTSQTSGKLSMWDMAFFWWWTRACSWPVTSILHQPSGLCTGTAAECPHLQV